jgi:hypothetical protein
VLIFAKTLFSSLDPELFRFESFPPEPAPVAPKKSNFPRMSFHVLRKNKSTMAW